MSIFKRTIKQDENPRYVRVRVRVRVCVRVCVFASVVASVREYVRLNYREHDRACVLLNGISCASMYNNSSLCK